MNKQEIIEQIDELKQKIEQIEKEVKSSEFNEVKKGVRWKPEGTELYYFIDDDGDILSETWEDYSCDEFRFNTGNCFKTEQEAEEYKENLITKQALKDLTLELNNGVEIDWEDNEQAKFYIYYDYKYENLVSHWSSCVKTCVTYCLDRNFLKIAKERIGEEKLIKLIKSGV